METSTAITQTDTKTPKTVALRLLNVERLLMGIAFIGCGLAGIFDLLPHGSVDARTAMLGGLLIKAGFLFPLLKGTEVLLELYLASMGRPEASMFSVTERPTIAERPSGRSSSVGRIVDRDPSGRACRDREAIAAYRTLTGGRGRSEHAAEPDARRGRDARTPAGRSTKRGRHRRAQLPRVAQRTQHDSRTAARAT